MVEFRAACYYQVGDDGNIKHIVFAFGGTDPLKIWDDLSDVWISRGGIAPFFYLSVAWAKWMVDQIYQTFGADIFTRAHGTMTGHSLGAHLAQMVFLYTHGLGESFEKRPFVNYVGYENPGVMDSLTTLCGSLHKALELTNNFYHFCKTVHGLPNVINACQRQFGKVYYVQPPCDVIFPGYKIPFPIPMSPLRNIEYFVYKYSFHAAHAIETIMKGIEIGEPVQRNYQRRLTMNGAYYDYLSLQDMEGYWKDYTAAAWASINQSRFRDYNDFSFQLNQSRQDAAKYCNPSFAKNKMILLAVKNDTPVIDVRPHEEKKSSCLIS